MHTVKQFPLFPIYKINGPS